MTAMAKFRPDVFASAVKAARQQRGWSVLELAFRLGMDKSTITNLEHNRTVPHIETFARLCEVLNLDPKVFWTKSTD